MKLTVMFSRVVNTILCSFSLCIYPSILSAETLIIGTLSYNPPFESVSKQKQFLGLDIEVMEEVCASLKVNCEFKALGFMDIFKQIDSGEIDLGIAAIISDKERQRKYSLSIPYFPSSAQFFVNRHSLLKKTSQLLGKRIGTVLDPIFISYLHENYTSDDLKVYNHIESGLLDLTKNGKIDAFFLDTIAVNYWLLNTKNQLSSLGEKIIIGEGYSIVAKKNRQALIDKINNALLNMRKNGTDIKIFESYL